MKENFTNFKEVVCVSEEPMKPRALGIQASIIMRRVAEELSLAWGPFPMQVVMLLHPCCAVTCVAFGTGWTHS